MDKIIAFMQELPGDLIDFFTTHPGMIPVVTIAAGFVGGIAMIRFVRGPKER
jgi:hypothetical protein